MTVPRHRGIAPVASVAFALALLLAPSTPTSAQTTAGSASTASLPRSRAPRPTSAAITAADLMTRVYVFADDSMQGREAGTVGHERAIGYLTRELARIGLRPGGVNGSWYQDVPLLLRAAGDVDLRVDGEPLVRSTDYAPTMQRGAVRTIAGRYETVFGGGHADRAALTREQVAGRVVLMAPRPAAWRGPVDPREALASAAAIVVAGLEELAPAQRTVFAAPTLGLPAASYDSSEIAPPIIHVTRAVAERLLGMPLTQAKAGAAGRPIDVRVAFTETPRTSRNVIAVLPGRDAALRGQYVSIGAHTDHDGIGRTAVDHDSLKTWLAERRRILLRLDEDADEVLTPEQQRSYAQETAAIRVNVDSLRRIRPARPDSIFNGAEDDASGSMALLEIAEELAARRTRPRRSMLFVWHTAEEKGLLGSRHFVDHPTVPRDSIVANINLDHAGGRATAADHRAGGADYLNFIGAGRVSTMLDSVVRAVNARQPRPMRFDEALNRPGNSVSAWCRSDHASFARRGIPVAFLTAAFFSDYHQVTDEPQYLDYAHLERATRLARDVLLAVAEMPKRPLADRPAPDPLAGCRQ